MSSPLNNEQQQRGSGQIQVPRAAMGEQGVYEKEIG